MKKLILLFICVLTGLTGMAQENTRYTTVDLNMRTDTTVYSDIVMLLRRGTAVAVADDCDCRWLPVEYQGRTGYVSSRFLSKKAPQKDTEHAVTPRGKVKYYTNSAGERVQSPTHYNSVPAGATALCRDGTYSFSQSRRGTCSHHEGVSIWY